MLDKFKVIIAGGRHFKDYSTLCKVCDHMLKNKSIIEIVSGKAKGADTLGEQYAKERGYKIKEFPANWELGKAAGYIRNKDMAYYADALIAFWDKNSKGTKHMIDLAKEKNLKIKIVYYDNN